MPERPLHEDDRECGTMYAAESGCFLAIFRPLSLPPPPPPPPPSPLPSPSSHCMAFWSHKIDYKKKKTQRKLEITYVHVLWAFFPLNHICINEGKKNSTAHDPVDSRSEKLQNTLHFVRDKQRIIFNTATLINSLYLLARFIAPCFRITLSHLRQAQAGEAQETGAASSPIQVCTCSNSIS